MFIRLNENPANLNNGDCVIRALSTVLDRSWLDIFWALAVRAANRYDLPNSDAVWGLYLKELGFNKYVIPNFCPDCYTIKDFCRENPYGRFVLSTGPHVVAVIDGNYFDTLDCGDEIPIYYWKKEELL